MNENNNNNQVNSNGAGGAPQMDYLQNGIHQQDYDMVQNLGLDN